MLLLSLYIRFQVPFVFVLLLLCLRIYHKRSLPLLNFLGFLFLLFLHLLVVALFYQFRFIVHHLYNSCIVLSCSLKALKTGLKSKFIVKLLFPFLFFKHTSCTSLGIFFFASLISSFVGVLFSDNIFNCIVSKTSAVYSMPSTLFKCFKRCGLRVVHTIKRRYRNNWYFKITAYFFQ